MRSFFAELKRRNVLRAGALYIGAAWALSQGLAQLLPVFDIANWVTRWFVIAAVIGFPFLLAFSWFYEFTPSGLKLESQIDPSDSVTHATGKKLDRWIIATLGLAVVLLLTDRFVLHKSDESATESAIPGKSIAVLPFENLSDDKSNAYFSDGITEEILDALAQIPDLKVAARRSAFQFKGSDLDLHKIGVVLGVANVLEGSVQKSGDQVRTNVQLIDAQSGLQLWSEKYDRKLDNVFTVEDDIARSIATRLRVQLTGGAGQKLIAGSTNNPQAHELFLRGLALLSARGPGLRDAVTAFQQAVKLDPNYAQAWGALAETEIVLPAYGLESMDQALQNADDAAQRAKALDPTGPSAFIALGNIYSYRFEWQQADEAFRRALTLAPGDAEAVNQYAQFLFAAGDLEAGLREIDHAQQLDPVSAIIGAVEAGTLAQLRRYDEAATHIQNVLLAHPDFFPAHTVAADLYINRHLYTQAEVELRALGRLAGEDVEAKAILVRGIADPTLHAQALQSLDTSPANADLRADPIFYALYLAWLGENDRALDQLDIYAAKRNSTFGAYLWDQAFDPVRTSPRFKAMLAKVGIPYVPAKENAKGI
jgi:adenylate cyclase